MNSAKIKASQIASLLFILCLSTLIASAQNISNTKNYEFCSDNNWSNGDRESFKELRETTVKASNQLTVDANKNGGIKVKGSDRSDVLVRACVQAWADSVSAAQSIAKNVRVETGSTVRAQNSTDDLHWSVSYEILVPRSMNLKLSTYNGGIGISSVEGTMEFEAYNGGISLDDVAGSVKGKTRNGGLSVKLSGNSWKGSGLDVETTNGGVKLSMPDNYAAKIEAGTTNGGFKSNIDGLTVQKTRWTRSTGITTDFNGGGAPIRVVTTNGGVIINSEK